MKKALGNNNKLRGSMQRLLVILATFVSVTSCGLVDFELSDQEIQDFNNLYLEPDTITLIQGDSIELIPKASATSVYPGPVYWASSADTVACFRNNIFYALEPGRVSITATSVLNDITASCEVSVMPKWEVNAYEYPYEMIVYAKVNLGEGKKYDPATMMIGAFCNGDIRGLGEPVNIGGTDFFQFRIYSLTNNFAEGDEETIRFAVYDRKNYSLRTFPQRLNFDSETHGTISDLYELKMK